jgi:hypothetical protein
MQPTLLIAICLIGFVALTTVFSLRWGALAYLTVVLFAPNVMLETTYFRVEHILTPVLLALILAKTALKRQYGGIRAVVMLYVLWLGWLWLITAISMAQMPNVPFDMRAIYGLVRPGLVMLAFSLVDFDKTWLSRRAALFCYAAIPLGILGVGQTLNIPLFRWITEAAYISPGRDVFFRSLDAEGEGYVLRAISVFENVSYAATYFLLALYTGFALLTSSEKRFDRRERLLLVASMLAACFGGIFTMSGTFLGGALLLWVWTLISTSWRTRAKLVVFSLLALVVVTATFSYLPEGIREQVGLVTDYQADRLSSAAFLHGRLYREKDYALLDSWETAVQRPLVGWGFFSPEGVVINDSIYLLLFYTGGAIGCVIFTAVLTTAVKARSRKDIMTRLLLIWLGVLVLAGFGSTSFFIVRLLDWWWAFVGVHAGLQRKDKLALSGSAQGGVSPLAIGVGHVA